MGASVKNKRFPGLPAPDVEALYKKVTKTAKETPNDFIVGRMLNELKEMDKFYFEQCIKNLPLGRRKAYYLQSVYSKYASLHIDVGELHEIGWTKLPVMAKTVNRDNVKLYLDMAKDSNTRQLRAKLAEDYKLAETKAVTLYFDKDQRPVFDAILEENGAGQFGREAALTKALANAPTKSR
jgi:hypothetical protein